MPLITLEDFDVLLDAAGSAPRAVVVGASHDGQGTNALLLRPPDVIASTFGPPSLHRHAQAGLDAGALTLVRHELGVSHDIDTPHDLRALRDSSPGPRTAAALQQLF